MNTQPIAYEQKKPAHEDIVRIIQGLLASGHYTTRVQVGPKPEYETAIVSYDRGKEYKEDGYKRRRVPQVVEAAIELLHDLNHYLWELDEMAREEREEREREEKEPTPAILVDKTR